MIDSIHKAGGRSEWSLARCVYYGGLDLESAQPRNVFVLFDGTWNDEAGGSRTNVHKLWTALEESEHQIKHYFRGVGNDEEHGVLGRIVGGLTGIGERRIRRDAYSTLELDHRAGDRIFILGFSRGAASARLLASDLHRLGLPRRVRVTRARTRSRRAWSEVEERFVAFEPFPPYLRPIDVHFLGVWDTVGAFGVPVEILGFNVRTPKSRIFHDNTIAANVRHATHCVAIDETRDAFEPTLFNHKPGVVDEVWFAGVHSDVGGGYRRDEDRLGDHTLRYMAGAVRDAAICDHAHAGAPAGDPGCAGATPLPVAFDEARLAGELREPATTTLHTHGHGWKKSGRVVRVRYGPIDAGDADPPGLARPRVHASALDLVGEAIDYVRKRAGPLRDRRWTAPYAPEPLARASGSAAADREREVAEQLDALHDPAPRE